MQSVPTEEEFSLDRYSDEWDERMAQPLEEQLRALRRVQKSVNEHIADLQEELAVIGAYAEELLKK